MPVFKMYREEKPGVGFVIDLQQLIEDVQAHLKKFHDFDVDWISEYLDDAETDLLLDPSMAECEQIWHNVKNIQSKLEEIEEDYDFEYDTEDIQEELDDLEDDIDLF